MSCMWWMDGRMDACMRLCMDAQMLGCLNASLFACFYVRISVLAFVCLFVCMGGPLCLSASVYIYIHKYICVQCSMWCAVRIVRDSHRRKVIPQTGSPVRESYSLVEPGWVDLTSFETIGPKMLESAVIGNLRSDLCARCVASTGIFFHLSPSILLCVLDVLPRWFCRSSVIFFHLSPSILLLCWMCCPDDSAGLVAFSFIRLQYSVLVLPGWF